MIRPLPSLQPVPCRSGKNDILKVDLIAPSAAVANMTAQELADAEVKLNMKMDSRGFLRVGNAVLSTPFKAETMGGKFMGLFGGSKEKKDDAAMDEAEKGETEDVEIAESGPKEKTVVVTFRESAMGLKPLDKDAKKLAKSR